MKSFIITIVMIFLFSLSGCSNENDNLNNDITNYFSYARKTGTGNEHERNIDIIEQREEYISNEIKTMMGVDKATVEITGKKAIVWITVSKGINDEEIIVLKDKIRKHVDIIDEEIKHVTVSASPELISRVNDMVEIY